jgi:glutathione peroxidase
MSTIKSNWHLCDNKSLYKSTKLYFLLAFTILFIFSNSMVFSKDNCSSNILNTVVKDIDGKDVNLCNYEGKVLLIVNTASKCGFAGQYKDLEKLYEKYKAKGFEVLAFPSNDFAGQEPGNETEIKKFCTLNYQATFPLFSKVHVKGKQQNPLYQKLTSAKGGVQWNFQKYLVARNGQVVKKFSPWTSPLSDDIEKAIVNELNKISTK